MSFIRKHSGDSTRPIVAVYTCLEHGLFDYEVERDGRGEAPDIIACPAEVGDTRCGMLCGWTPTPVACRVRRIEAVKGKWQEPERKTFLDTRDMGEGMDEEEFRAKRAKIWDEKRKQDVMNIKRGFE